MMPPRYLLTKKNGADIFRSVASTLGVIRTRDPLVRNQVLYPLSYEGTTVVGFYNNPFKKAILISMKQHSLNTQTVLFAAIRTVFNTAYRMVYPFLAVFSRSLGVDISSLSRALANRSAIGALGPFLAAIADRRGRKAGMLLGIGLFSVGLGVLVFWPSYPAFILMLTLTALGKYGFDPSMQAYLGDKVPYKNRGKNLAITEVGWSLSFMLGIPSMSFLIVRLGWQSPFVVLLGMAIMAGGILVWLIPNDIVRKKDHATIWRNFGKVFRYPPALAGLVVGLTASTANETINLVFGVWMEDAFQLQIIALGGTAAVIGLGEVLVGGFVDRLGKVRAVNIGLLLNCLVALFFPLLGNSSSGAVVGLFLFYITFEFTLVSIIPLMTEVVPDARATLMAFNVTALSLGRTLGALIAIPLYGWGISASAGASVAFNLIAILALRRVRVR